MRDLLTFLVILLGLTLVGWVAWRAGHDTAQREAHFTIAELRRGIRIAQLDRDRAVEHNNRLLRMVNRTNHAEPVLPSWLKP